MEKNEKKGGGSQLDNIVVQNIYIPNLSDL